jgi:hypothetical protein
MNNPLLLFVNAADNAAAYPLSGLIAMTVAADATILMKFKSSIGGTATSEFDLVTITCVADTELSVFKAIASGISSPSAVHEGYVVVADDVAGKFVDSNISSITITLDT